MLPSRKRQTTPPEASPAKRPTPALPAPDGPPPNAPSAEDPLILEAREWSTSLRDQLSDLMSQILYKNPLPCFDEDRFLVPALRFAREELVSYVNDIDRLASENTLGLPHPCPTLCTAVPHPPTTAEPHPSATPTSDPPTRSTAHKSVETEPPVPTPGPVPRSYASVAVGTPAAPAPKTSDPKPPPKPPRSKPKGLGLAPARSAVPPVRLIVRPGPSPSVLEFPFAALFLKGPSEPFRLLSHALALNPSTRDVKLLGVHQNRSKNLVVSLAPGTPDADLADIIPITCSALTPQLSGGPGPTPTVIRDTPWSKLLILSVLARSGPSAPTFSEADVQASFLTNPAVSALKVTRPPRWIRNPASITGAHSSFTFSFEDPDGSLARSLAKSSLFVFGVPVHLKRWIEKPLHKRKETLRRRMATSSSD